MKKYTAEELKDIIDKHGKWLRGEDGGERANLSGSNLSYSNLRGSDLSGSDLSGSNLRGSNLSYSNLSYSNLSGSDLSGSNLSYSNLRGSDLSGSDLSGSDLSYSDLSGSDLSGSNLSYSNLRGSNLIGSDLSGSNLRGSNLSYSNLRGSNLELDLVNKFFPMCCPESGSFIGWKKAKDKVIKLEIQEDALRSSAYGRKCRCSKVKVLAIENADGNDSGLTEIASDYNKNFVYRVGEIIEEPKFDKDRRNECAPGIHFFITRAEAVNY